MFKYLKIAALSLGFLFPLTSTTMAAKYTLQVDGLACPFCAYGIEKQLNKTKGVTNIKININDGIITVTTAKGKTMSKAQAARIVKNAGFTLRGFKTLN